MKKLYLFGLVLMSLMRADAQRIHLSLFGGVSNYQGDLQSKRLTLQQANAVFGVGALYEVSEKLYVRANVNFAKVQADDKISGIYLDRNLSFSSPVTEVQLGLEYDLLNSYEKKPDPICICRHCRLSF
jgi:hypothetical protein